MNVPASTRFLLALILSLALGAPAGADPWAIPAEGSCAPAGGLRGDPAREDSKPVPFDTGDVFDLERIDALRDYLPDFIWQHRERFFYEGMSLEIGPCFRDYAPPAFFQEATRSFSGQASLAEDGGLSGNTAGLPFDPATIAPDDSRAGLKWLWNVQYRYQAAGFFGKFRMMDLVGRIGRAEPFEGEIFKVLMSRRADRPDDDYEAPGANGNHWVSGGLFLQPFNAREYAWRQYRNLENERAARRSDDLHAYLPQWRRVRRISASQVEGIYMPTFSVGVVPNQNIAVGGGESGGAGAGTGGIGAGGLAGSIQNKRSGWEGLEYRPLLYGAQPVGVHDVLTPINLGRALYPEESDREFGPWGLSFASDRWDLRRALVLRLTGGEFTPDEDMANQLLYVDLQTLQPLYLATLDRKQEMTNVGMYAGRWSEDREDYRPWPDDSERPIRVIDSVGAAFANLAESGSWRRESWDVTSTPPKDRKVKQMISTGELTKRR